MIATIIDTTQEKGCCGSQRVYAYLIVETSEKQRLTLPRSDFPFAARSIGDQVDLQYVAVGRGHRYLPFRLEREA